MGCYDSVCSVSHIPIAEGDDVVLIYVGASMYQYQLDSAKYYPVALPLFGEYDDYGDIEYNKTENEFNLPYFENTINENFKNVIPLPRFSDSDLIETFRHVTIFRQISLPDEWVALGKKTIIEDGKITQHNGSAVGKFFAHRNIFDYFVNHFKANPLDWNNPTLGQQVFDDIPLFVDSIIETRKIMNEYEQLKDVNDEDMFSAFCEKNGFNKDTFHSVYVNVLFGRTAASKQLNSPFNDDYYLNHLLNAEYNSYYQPMVTGATRYIVEIIRYLAEKSDRQTLIHLLTSLLTLDAFGRGLWRHNLNYSPYTGHSAEQHQDIDGATDMLNLFKVYEGIQTAGLDRIKSYEDE